MKQLSPSSRGHKEEAEEGRKAVDEGRETGKADSRELGRDYTPSPASRQSKGSVSVIVANREPLCNGCRSPTLDLARPLALAEGEFSETKNGAR